MDIMYIRHKLGGPSPLWANEELVYSQQDFSAISLSCPPIGYGIWRFPFLRGISLSISNRRVFPSCRVLPFYRQECDLWFPGQEPENRPELITGFSFEEGRYG